MHVKITCILVFSDNNSFVRKCSICNCEINTLYKNDMYANEMYANERLHPIILTSFLVIHSYYKYL